VTECAGSVGEEDLDVVVIVDEAEVEIEVGGGGPQATVFGSLSKAASSSKSRIQKGRARYRMLKNKHQVSKAHLKPVHVSLCPPFFHLVKGENKKRKKKGGEGSKEDLDVLRRASSMRSPCLPRFPEQARAHNGRDEPQHGIRQQHPDAVLHAGNALVALWILVNVHASKDAKRNDIADEDDDVYGKEEPRFDERQHKDQRREGAEGAAYNGPHPLAVDVFSLLARVVQVDSVQADDGETHDKLEEAHDKTQDGHGREGGPKRGSHCGFLASQSAIREEFEAHFDDETVYIMLAQLRLFVWRVGPIRTFLATVLIIV
jgi:flagellar basal body rod protein FlgC